MTPADVERVMRLVLEFASLHANASDPERIPSPVLDAKADTALSAIRTLLLSIGEWRPIGEASKTERVLLYFPPGELFSSDFICCGAWDDDRFAKKPRPYWAVDAKWIGAIALRAAKPTHYQPLPPPPTPTGGDGR